MSLYCDLFLTQTLYFWDEKVWQFKPPKISRSERATFEKLKISWRSWWKQYSANFYLELWRLLL